MTLALPRPKRPPGPARLKHIGSAIARTQLNRSSIQSAHLHNDRRHVITPEPPTNPAVVRAYFSDLPDGVKVAPEVSIFFRNLQGNPSDDRHVHKTREVQLGGDGHGIGRAVSMLGHNEVGLARARRLLVVVIVAMQQDDDIGVLLNAVV